MAAGHGGARTGAGRKKKGSSPAEAQVGAAKAPAQTPAQRAAAGSSEELPTSHPDALAYLQAVVKGIEPPDGLRIAAAKAVLAYESPKARAPVKSLPPEQLRQSAKKAAAKDGEELWAAKEAAIRAKFSTTKKERLQ